jgi:hypothetical protein
VKASLIAASASPIGTIPTATQGSVITQQHAGSRRRRVAPPGDSHATRVACGAFHRATALARALPGAVHDRPGRS